MQWSVGWVKGGNINRSHLEINLWVLKKVLQSWFPAHIIECRGSLKESPVDRYIILLHVLYGSKNMGALWWRQVRGSWFSRVLGWRTENDYYPLDGLMESLCVLTACWCWPYITPGSGAVQCSAEALCRDDSSRGSWDVRLAERRVTADYLRASDTLTSVLISLKRSCKQRAWQAGRGNRRKILREK